MHQPCRAEQSHDPHVYETPLPFDQPFSKKFANLEHAINLHMAYYNFCWRPGTTKYTPSEAAGLTGYCWTFDELLAG